MTETTKKHGQSKDDWTSTLQKEDNAEEKEDEEIDNEAQSHSSGEKDRLFALSDVSSKQKWMSDQLAVQIVSFELFVRDELEAQILLMDDLHARQSETDERALRIRNKAGRLTRKSPHKTVKTFKVAPPDDIDPDWKEGVILKNPSIRDAAYPDKITGFDPATGRLLSRMAQDQPESVQAIVHKTRQAQKQWSQTSLDERIAVLQSLKQFIVNHQEEICRVSARVTGKTLIDASLGEIVTTLAKIDWLMSNAKSVLKTEYRSTNILMFYKYAMVEYLPLGVTGAIISWNYPFHNAFGVILSSILAGNGVVIKASEHSCHSSNYFQSIIKTCLEAHQLNANLVNFITGDGKVGEALVRSDIDKITFIGSPAVGKLVMKTASENLVPLVLELGGKDAALIRHDADLDHVVPLMMRGVFQNAGQNCIGIERIIVHSSLKRKFINSVEPLVKKLSLNRPLGCEPSDCGAITMSHHCQHIDRLVKDAISKGAICLVGGKMTQPNQKCSGSFYKPTLLVDCNKHMLISKEEIFGPVMCVYSYESDQEAVDIVNSTGFGLGGSIFSRNIQEARQLSRKMNLGMININDFGVNFLCQLPFGGVGKSGFGRFGGIEGLRGDCQIRAVTQDKWPYLIRTSLPKHMQYPMSWKSWAFSKALVKTLGRVDDGTERFNISVDRKSVALFSASLVRRMYVPQQTSSPTPNSKDQDLYSGYEQKSASFGFSSGRGSTRSGVVQAAANTSRRPESAFRMPTGVRMGTAAGGINADGSAARPMTAVRAAGFSRAGRNVTNNSQTFDPMSQGNSQKTAAVPPEETLRAQEKKISDMLDDSCISSSKGHLEVALEKAKEALKKERTLMKQREQHGLVEQANLDLTFCVLLNLANQYQNNTMWQEALNTYSVIVKNKSFNLGGRFRVNMGNIYFQQKKFSQAIKMYRMALDQLPNVYVEMRLKIMQNIANAFIKTKQYQEAIISLENIMETCPDHKTGTNLVLCYYALGDQDQMKRGFTKLLMTKPRSIEQNDQDIEQDSNSSWSEEPIENQKLFNEDALRARARTQKRFVERTVSITGKLIAAYLAPTIQEGFEWIVNAIKISPLMDLAGDMEIAKAVLYLEHKDFPKAIETLKAFEKKDKKYLITAATNLSFIYLLEGDIKQADKYADLVISYDKYNAKALTNKGNVYFAKGNFEKSKQTYQMALNVDALCPEALFNLGLTQKRTNNIKEALLCFQKLHKLVQNSAEVLYRIADGYKELNELSQASEWFKILISVVPTDPYVLASMGDLMARQNDNAQAFQCYTESYRFFPSDIAVVSWLGNYHLNFEAYEAAIPFFKRATRLQPQEIKWKLLMASCQRRSGNYQLALETYEKIYEQHPDNIECRTFLNRIRADLGLVPKQFDLDSIETSH